MQKIIRGLHVLDYVAGAGTVAYGAYQHSPLLIGLGIAGLALAKMNLAQRLSGSLQKYLLRKRAAPANAVANEPMESPLPPAQDLSRVSYVQQGLQVGPLRVGGSRHSLLRSDAHLNHAEPGATLH